MKALSFQISAGATISLAALATALATLSNPPDISAITPATAESLVPKLEQVDFDRDASSELLAVITDRPLFSRTRRPFKPVPSASPSQIPVPQKSDLPSPEASPAQNLVLRGVFLNDKNARALIASEVNPGGAWIRKGERINGWRLNTVEPEAVELEQMGRKAALKLYAHETTNGLNPPAQPYIEQQHMRKPKLLP